MCAVYIFQSARAGRCCRRPLRRRTHAAAGAVGWSQLMRRAVMHRIGFSLLQGPFYFGSFSVQVFELPSVCVLYGFLFTAQFFIVLSLLCGRVGESRAPKDLRGEAFSHPKIQTSQPKVRFDARMAAAGFSCVFCGHELTRCHDKRPSHRFVFACCLALLLRLRVTVAHKQQTTDRQTAADRQTDREKWS
jgi:hypothetical protein